ncbi:hypothetical protein TYRP_011161 [Tyrophagus putrescentiae]|nr:hypothetical protein TYRP_011161 [Tyrophagus putrescentiae]
MPPLISCSRCFVTSSVIFPVSSVRMSLLMPPDSDSSGFFPRSLVLLLLPAHLPIIRLLMAFSNSKCRDLSAFGSTHTSQHLLQPFSTTLFSAPINSASSLELRHRSVCSQYASIFSKSFIDWSLGLLFGFLRLFSSRSC